MWQIAAATGWSVRHILWGVNCQTLRMMLADAPRYVRKKQKHQALSGFIQSKLNKHKPDAQTR